MGQSITKQEQQHDQPFLATKTFVLFCAVDHYDACRMRKKEEDLENEYIKRRERDLDDIRTTERYLNMN